MTCETILPLVLELPPYERAKLKLALDECEDVPKPGKMTQEEKKAEMFYQQLLRSNDFIK